MPDLFRLKKQKLNKERRKIDYNYIYYQKKLNKFESQKPASLIHTEGCNDKNSQEITSTVLNQSTSNRQHANQTNCSKQLNEIKIPIIDLKLNQRNHKKVII